MQMYNNVYDLQTLYLIIIFKLVSSGPVWEIACVVDFMGVALEESTFFYVRV